MFLWFRLLAYVIIDYFRIQFILFLNISKRFNVDLGSTISSLIRFWTRIIWLLISRRLLRLMAMALYTYPRMIDADI